MNIAGVMLLRFIGSLPHSAEAQAAYAVGYAELFALITWTSVGLMGAAAAVAGQNLGAGHPERAIRGVHDRGAHRHRRRRNRRRVLPAHPRIPARHLRPARSQRRRAWHAAAALPVCLGLLHHGGAHLHRRPAGHRRHAQPALHHAGLASAGAARACAGRSRASAGSTPPASGRPSFSVTSRAVCLSVLRFRQGKWRQYSGRVAPEARGTAVVRGCDGASP